MGDSTAYSVPIAIWNEIQSERIAYHNEMRWRFASKPDDADNSPEPMLVTVRHLIVDSDSDDWPPFGAKEFMAWFDAKLRQIPAKWRGSALIGIEPEGGYDERSTVEISISYQRPETKSEIAERRAGYAERMAMFEKRQQHEAEVERATFETLKAKFASDSGSDPKGEDTVGG